MKDLKILYFTFEAEEEFCIANKTSVEQSSSSYATPMKRCFLNTQFLQGIIK